MSISDNMLKAMRSRWVAEVDRMAPDPDRQDELVSTMAQVEIIDELLLFRAAAATMPRRREGLLRAAAEAMATRSDIIEAIAIVRDLADDSPIVHTESTWHICGLCQVSLPVRIEDHAESCAHRRAVEWVQAHPAEEDE